MTIVLDVSFNDQHSDSQNSVIIENCRKKVASSSKSVKVAKVKNKVRNIDFGINFLLRWSNRATKRASRVEKHVE